MTQALSEPFPGPEPISFNNLNTEIVAEQPGKGSVLARTYFDAGNGPGYKYYIYNRETESADFFTRVYPSEHGDLVAYWHPTGNYLYYRIPGERDWHVYDARIHSHFRLGPLPEGLWSKDARYRVQWIKPDFEPGSGPVPKLSVWDSATNRTRRYCLPGTGYMGFDGTLLLWSPDNRYIAFRALPVARGDDFLTPTAVTTATPTPVPTFTLEEQRDHSLYNVYIIDLHTGAMAVIDAEETQQLLLWTSEEYTP
jgi:hypothetical protein